MKTPSPAWLVATNRYLTRNGWGCPPRKRVPRGVRGWMVRPPLNQPPFLLLRFPSLPLPSLVLISVHEGEGSGEGRGEGAILAGPFAPPEAGGLWSATVPPLSSLLASSYSLSRPSSLPPSASASAVVVVGRLAGSTIHSVRCTAARSPVYPPSFSMCPCLWSVCHASLSPLFISW